MVDIVSYRVTIGLFYNKISMICLRKARKVSVCLSDFIDMFLLYLRHVMSWCLVKYKSNYNIILSYLLLFNLLIVCGDIELNPGPQGTPVSHENTLSIFHANIRSLRNKLNYIIDIVEDFDIVFFTETHLDNSISDADISLPGFEVPIRRDRNCSGGGIIFYYKNFVNVIRRKDLEHGDLLECMWFELKTKFQSILININYRSVRQAPAYYWQYFDFMLKRSLDENCNIICLGDFEHKCYG